MLRVKTYIDKSLIHGVGIFAAENIPTGKIIWEFNPHVDLVYAPEEWQKLERSISVESFHQLLKYSYKTDGKYYLCVDSAQFMNHSIEKCNIGNDRINDVMFALRDIKQGEELLCNYFDFCDDDDYNLTALRD